MKMKKIVLLLLITVFSLQGCKNIDFGDYNKNPIGPSEPSPKDLLAGGMMNYFNNTGRYELTVPTLYVQWQVQTAYPEEMKYADVPVSWTAKYVRVLSNFKTNIDYIQAHRDDVTPYGYPDNQIAVNKIMMAYVFKELADSYGDIPFSEALDPDNITPKYDSQIEVYHGIIDMLKEARDMIDVSVANANIVGDILYNGDIIKWKKLANSLILHAALQLSNVPSEVNYAKQEFTAALNNSAGVLEDIDDDAWIHYSASDRFFQNPYSRMRRGDYALAKEFTDALKGTGSCNPTFNTTYDPRIEIYSSNPAVDGSPYSDCSPGGGSAQISDYIWSVTEPDKPLPFFLSSWTWLDRAEAAARGWTSEDYDTALENGLRNSFDAIASHYANYSNSLDVDAYITARIADANNATYGDGNEDPKVIVVAEEKWKAMFPRGFEAWTQWRRLHYPTIQSPPANETYNGGVIPRRYSYPSEEATVNPEHRDEAVQNGLTPAEDFNTSRTRWDQ